MIDGEWRRVLPWSGRFAVQLPDHPCCSLWKLGGWGVVKWWRQPGVVEASCSRWGGLFDSCRRGSTAWRSYGGGSGGSVGGDCCQLSEVAVRALVSGP